MATQLNFQSMEEYYNYILKTLLESNKSGAIKSYPDYDIKKVFTECWNELITVKEKINNESKFIISVASIDSTLKAFSKMANLGLSSIKKQGYFRLQNQNMTFTPSYLGSIYIAKRDLKIERVTANAVYELDELDYEIDVNTGYKKILSHKQKLGNINNAQIIGAYAMAIYPDGLIKAEIMSFTQIKNSWELGGAKGNSTAHLKFPEEMAKKTVINRLLKEDLTTNGVFDEDFEEQETTDHQQSENKLSSKIEEVKNIRAPKDLPEPLPISEASEVLFIEDDLPKEESKPQEKEPDPF